MKPASVCLCLSIIAVMPIRPGTINLVTCLCFSCEHRDQHVQRHVSGCRCVRPWGEARACPPFLISVFQQLQTNMTIQASQYTYVAFSEASPGTAEMSCERRTEGDISHVCLTRSSLRMALILRSHLYLAVNTKP